jgi:rhodanese-related sulfurtransferase
MAEKRGISAQKVEQSLEFYNPPPVSTLMDGAAVDFLIANWYLVLTALVSGGLLLWPVLQGGAGAGIPASEAVRLMNREKAVVIDVCEPAEFAAGHIGAARNIPLNTLESATNLPNNKKLPVVVVCAAGVRAARGAQVLRAKGYENVQVLAGGMRGWREANLPVESSKA